jgi:hypothetical protein
MAKIVKLRVSGAPYKIYNIGHQLPVALLRSGPPPTWKRV